MSAAIQGEAVRSVGRPRLEDRADAAARTRESNRIAQAKYRKARKAQVAVVNFEAADEALPEDMAWNPRISEHSEGYDDPKALRYE